MNRIYCTVRCLANVVKIRRMNSPQSSTEDFQDDTFIVEENHIKDPALVLQRLKEFTYYLVDNIEYNLNFCLKLLEERTVSPSKNSIHVTALSVLFSAIPKIGGGLGSALKAGETTIFREIEKKNSRILADMVYYFSDNRETFRNIIIEAAIEIFASFENQFMQLTCNRGETKAMQKLAVDASDRIFDYFLITEQKRDVTINEVIKGVIFGNSKRNAIGKKDGKSVKNKKASNSEEVTKWKTSKLYSKAGIVILDRNLCYYNEHTKPEKYKYRKILPWENEDEIMRTWTLDTNVDIPEYTIKISEHLLNDVKQYVMKTPDEVAKLERKKYHEVSMIDRQEKHEIALQILKEYLNKILNEMDELVLKVTNTIENSELLKTVAENRGEENKFQTHIVSKLDIVHNDVVETKEKQDHLIKTNEHISQEIVEIKNNQEEMAGSVIKQTDVEQLVSKMVKKGAAEGIKDLVHETLRKNDPGPKIHREVDRFLKKWKF